MTLFTEERPCVWTPEDVWDEYDLPFTPEGAWQFIANRAENGEEICEIEVRKPPGERAYVMLCSIQGGSTRIYIKVQILGEKILGRSFHYSNENLNES